MNYCPECGKKLEVKGKFCLHCGKKLTAEKEPKQKQETQKQETQQEGGIFDRGLIAMAQDGMKNIDSLSPKKAPQPPAQQPAPQQEQPKAQAPQPQQPQPIKKKEGEQAPSPTGITFAEGSAVDYRDALTKSFAVLVVTALAFMFLDVNILYSLIIFGVAFAGFSGMIGTLKESFMRKKK